MEPGMPFHFRIDHNYSIAANATQFWNWNWFGASGPAGGPNKGPVLFAAVPKGPSQGGNNTARNVLLTFDIAVCRGGPGDANAPEVFYEFKIRNDSSITVPFVLDIIHFGDLPIT
jgi:hypothetical protein